jgi:hypothetical protein
MHALVNDLLVAEQIDWRPQGASSELDARLKGRDEEKNAHPQNQKHSKRANLLTQEYQNPDIQGINDELGFWAAGERNCKTGFDGLRGRTTNGPHERRQF